MKPSRFLWPLLMVIVLAEFLVARTNPVPLVYQPLVPMTIKPGSTGFTLTVNGTGFAPSAVVAWNGATRITNYISSTQLQALINTTDVANPGTASITVVNPGAETSNAVFFPVQTPTPSVALYASGFSASGINAVGDFNKDGLLDLAVGDNSNGFFIDVYLGKGDGTFSSEIQNHSVAPITFLFAGGDFNGDGGLDVAALDGIGNSLIYRSHGAGALVQTQVFRSPGTAIATADFNADGKLDLVETGYLVEVNCAAVIRLGNGDGTFGNQQCLPIPNDYDPLGTPAIGDFNGDGNLDLAFPDSGRGVHVLLGNGDGTFKTEVIYSTQYAGFSATVADINGDGKLDIVTNGVSVLLGNGDGTFTNDGGVNLGGNASPNGLNIADLNGDDKLDLVLELPGNIETLLGNGDGTFQSPTVITDTGSSTVVIGDFNGDGKLDIVGHSLYLQGPVNLFPNSLNFGTQNVGTKSPPQAVTVTNDGSSTLSISSVGFGGTDPNDFSQTNNCGSLPVGGQCTINVVFAPTVGGSRSASLNVAYPGLGSPQTVALSGVGAISTVTLAPASLKFRTQLLGTTSPAQIVTLSNTGTVAVNISKISTSAQFAQTNNCPSSLPVNGSCQIQVNFAPTQKGHATGTLSVTDGAQGSPQTVTLSGNGTVVKLSAAGVNFGNQEVGTKSEPAPVQLTNIGESSLVIHQIGIAGKDPGDFSQTNNCGTKLAAGHSCTIQVTFAPHAKGQRSASLQISDNGGGSPQKVALSGKGI